MKNIIIIILLCWIQVLPITASELPEDKVLVQENVEEQLLDKLALSEIDSVLKDIFPREKLKFTGIVKSVLSGKTELTGELIGQLLFDQIFYEFQYNRKNLAHIIILAIMAAVVSNFSNVFQNKQISEMSFYILYLLILTLCLDSFRVVIAGVGDGLTQLLTFMEVLSPAYFLAVGISSGGSTAIVFYNI
ncbi:MAG: stage III sporulation protein AF, partial [Lachnospiraceae bacterium]